MISLHWVASLSLAEAAHNVHLPCGLAVVRVPYTARSSRTQREGGGGRHYGLLRQRRGNRRVSREKQALSHQWT